MDTDPKRSKAGQALVEFCIGLIAILTVFAGVLQLGRMGLARMQVRVEATGDASALSMTAPPGSYRRTRTYIRQVNRGADQRSYSVDDMTVQGNPEDVYGYLIYPNNSHLLQFYDRRVADAHRTERNTFSEIQTTADLMSETALVRSTAAETDIPVMPIIRKLFFSRDTVDMEVTSWSVRTGDIY